MKRLLTLVLVLMAMAIPATAQDDVYDDVINPSSSLQGTWEWGGPVVQATGTNFWAKLLKPFATYKVKSKLKKEYKKLGLDQNVISLVFAAKGTYALQVKGFNLISGTYTYDQELDRIVFSWHGISLSGDVKKNGKRIEFAMETDHLLKFLKVIAKLTGKSSLESINDLTKNYTDIHMGFALKKQ